MCIRVSKCFITLSYIPRRIDIYIYGLYKLYIVVLPFTTHNQHAWEAPQLVFKRFCHPRTTCLQTGPANVSRSWREQVAVWVWRAPSSTSHAAAGNWPGGFRAKFFALISWNSLHGDQMLLQQRMGISRFLIGGLEHDFYVFIYWYIYILYIYIYWE